MSGYNTTLTLSHHHSGDIKHERRSYTPKKTTNFPTQPPLPSRLDLQHPRPPTGKSPYRPRDNAEKTNPLNYSKHEHYESSKLFSSNHQPTIKYNPENGAKVSFPADRQSPQPLILKRAKERKGSENNIIFQSKLRKNEEKTDGIQSHVLGKERKGSCNNLWNGNMAPKAPRFSMVDPDQLHMINEAKPKAVARKWGENSQFQMEEVSLEEEASPIPMVKEFSAFPKPRKYSDNACAKKPPSFLTSPRGPDTRVKTPRAKFSIDRFIILKQLGKGAYGRVVLAVERESKFICAIKILSKQDLRQENMIEQFSREMKVQSFFNDPNIVKVYGCFEDLQHLYIVMECALDSRLSDVLKEQRMNESEAGAVFAQLCSAVSQLHAESVIHRDIKPENVMFHEGVVKVGDFGWSVFRGGQLRSTFCGTPLYLCPQILVGDSYDESVDVWALGIILYEMAVGCDPFNITRSEEMTKILHDQVNLQLPELSEELRSIIGACLSKKSEDRPSAKWLLTRGWVRRGMPDEHKRFSPSHSHSKC